MTSLLAILLTALPAAPPAIDNLDFSDGFAHWQGEGFELDNGGIRSRGREGKGPKALLHRSFVVPAGAGTLHFSAYATCSDDRLNVYLEAAERESVPKRVRTAKGFEKAPRLLPADGGKPREYVFSLADRVGDTVRIIVVDHLDKPGQFLWCSGFTIEPADRFETREFVNVMEALAREHKLSPMETPFRSKHFVAVSNTDEKFITEQLRRCELMHLMFLNHFAVKGFQLKPPASRLMVAIFDNQEGLEAYVGHRVAPTLAGVFHLASNRLVVYDFGRNRTLVASKERFEAQVQKLNDWQRAHLLGRMYRETGEVRTDTNIATLMHETAHQLAFNTGLMNREGDLPLWLAEGIATYCEPTEGGFWKGIGEMNRARLGPLRRAVKGEWSFLPLRSLVENDRWLRAPAVTPQQVMMGYSQSWAVVKMLMEEQPADLQRYCALIYPRRSTEHRLTDFAEVFGSDLAKLEKRHREYIKRIVNANP
jgi:hypothetical protein